MVSVVIHNNYHYNLFAAGSFLYWLILASMVATVIATIVAQIILAVGILSHYYIQEFKENMHQGTGRTV